MLEKITAPFKLSREAVRVFTVLAIAAQCVTYVVTGVFDMNSAGQLTLVALVGLISAAARKFVFSQETVDELTR